MSSPNTPVEKVKIPNFLDVLEHTLIKHKPSIIEFAEGKDYCNTPLFPRQKTLLKVLFLEELDDYDRRVIEEWEYSSQHRGEVTMCPKLETRMQYLKKKGFPHFSQIILVGGRRSSKSYLCGLIVAYKAYLLTLIDNVGLHFGIDLEKDVIFQILGGSKEQTQNTVFKDTASWINRCNAMIDQNLINRQLAESISIWTPYDKQKVLKLKSQQGALEADLAKIKVRAYGTNSRTIRGPTAMALVLDEFAHYMAGESRYSDEEIYQAAIPALRQFEKDALILASSSPYTKIGKFFDLYNLAMELDPPQIGDPLYPEYFMLQFPSWELYRDWEEFNMPNPPIREPKFLIELQREEKSNPEAFKVEYRSQFAEVEDAFLNPEMVDRMFDPEFTKKTIGRYITTEYGAKSFSIYKAHADPSSTGANFGVAVGHVEYIEEDVLDINGDSTGEKLLAPHVVFDYIDAFYPEDFPEHTIDWLEVLPHLMNLTNAFRPFEFTMDQYDSDYPIQKMRADLAQRGITETMIYDKPATHLKNYRRSMNFKAALNLGRIHAPHPTHPIEQGKEKRSIELVRDELKFLIEKNGRIDKPEVGPIRTKDIADCLFEVVDALIGDSIINIAMAETKPEFGAAGGFKIGGAQTQESPWSEWHENRRQAHQGWNIGNERGGRLYGKRQTRRNYR